MRIRYGRAMTMRTALFLAISTSTLTFATTALADESEVVNQSSQSSGSINSVGIGVQYGGLLGWQGSIQRNRSRFRLGIGFVGITPGYDYLLNSNVALGVQVFANQFFTGGGINLNYHFSSHTRPGWVIGLEVHRGYRSVELFAEGIVGFYDFFIDNENDNFDEDFAEIENRALLSVGYRF